MIKTAIQLKAKIRNYSNGDSNKALALLRTYIMERLLERLSLSPHKNQFVLKGGMLVSSIVGVNLRTTMDIDASVTSLTVSSENIRKVLEEIISIKLDDGISFRLTRESTIMVNFEYPGLRYTIEGYFENIVQTIQLDISTNDIMTPGPVSYSYPLMFENRCISLMSYNVETILGEKIETILSRGQENTRMRDFYDVYELSVMKGPSLNLTILKTALTETSKKRGTVELISKTRPMHKEFLSSHAMQSNWDTYRSNYTYVQNLSWADVLSQVFQLIDKL